VFAGADSGTVLTAASSTPEMKGVDASEMLVLFVNRLCTVCHMEIMCTRGDRHFLLWLQNGGIGFTYIGTRKWLGNARPSFAFSPACKDGYTCYLNFETNFGPEILRIKV
jgi:hypothetical protein